MLSFRDWCKTKTAVSSHYKGNYSSVIWFLIIFKIVTVIYVYYTYMYNDKVKHIITGSLTENFNFKIKDDEKLILLWTNFNGRHDFDNYCFHRDIFESTCPQTKCQFTVDNKQLLNANAIIFHEGDLEGPHTINGYDGYLELPKFRSELQYWIFMSFESPIHTKSFRPFDNLFNLTMTFRQDSDIYIPFGKLIPLGNNDQPRSLGFTNSSQKKGLVAWTSSNCCKADSRRNEVVHELAKYIKIDIYGTYGDRLCTPKSNNLCYSGLECHEYLSSNYKFYLAFENSLCEDYITEKFYDSLYTGMIPVVYGYGNYSSVAPLGSFIDVLSFPNLKALADHLHFLDTHPQEYNKYFDWKKRYSITIDYYDDAWCTLCTRLWDFHIHKNASLMADVERIVVRNLTDWWIYKKSKGKEKEHYNDFNSNSKESSCIDARNLKWDTSIFKFYGFLLNMEYRIKMRIIYSICTVAICFVAYIIFSILCRIRNRITLKVKSFYAMPC